MMTLRSDIAQLRERTAKDALKAINSGIFNRIEEFPAPVIAAINVRSGGQTVYNFGVSGDHNYYITDAQLLVHNCAMQARPGALANAWGYSTKQIKTAIERVKQQATWRGDGAHRNPDVLVDDVTGEVYPQVRGGTSAEDSIGNLFDHLPPGTR